MSEFLFDAVGIWLSGGWAMVVLAFNAFILFVVGLNVKLQLSERAHRKYKRIDWRDWITDPSQRKGEIGELVDIAVEKKQDREIESLFEEFHHNQVSPIERDLKIVRVCISISPLLGLLGTVTGMITTFNGLAVSTGGDKTINMVSSGISEALITTETGLIIAFPGLLFLHHLQQDAERYKALLAHVQTTCMQMLHLQNGTEARN